MILDEEILIPLYGQNIKHYEKLGYDIPRVYIKKNKAVVPKGTKIIVKINDLPDGSNEFINCKCDYCGKNFMRMYHLIVRSRRDGNLKDSCGETECTWLRNEDTRLIKYGSISQTIICQSNGSRLGRKLKYTIDDIIGIFDSRGLELAVDLISNIDDIRVTDSLPFTCNKHYDMGIQYTSVDMLKQHKHCCPYGAIDATSGENSWNWRGGVENDERHSYEYRKWRKDIYERDNFTCQCCGKTINDSKLNAHHILNFSEYEELRYENSNGITLCDECHSPNVKGSFHSIYGTHNNTKNQLEEYIRNKTGNSQYKINVQE